MGTLAISTSFYISKAIEVIQDMDGIKIEVTTMGARLESESLGKIFKAAEEMSEAVHNLQVEHVEVILKIDSKREIEEPVDEKPKSSKEYLSLRAFV